MDFELANALGRAVERKDMSTAAHTWRVTMYTQAMGEELGLAKDDLFSVMLGAVLHDIGKNNPIDGLAREGKLLATCGYPKKIRLVLELPRIQRLSEQGEPSDRRIDGDTTRPVPHGM